jgi:hypothetical protein
VGAQAQKILWGGDAWIRDLYGRLDLTSYYRRDGEQCFQFWKSFDVCADVDLCDRACAFPQPLPQYRNRLRFGNPAYPSTDGCSTLPANATNTGRLYVGYEFQEKITWKGRVTLSLNRLAAMVDKKEPDLSGCDPDEVECSIMQNCCYDPFSFTPRFPPYEFPPFPPSSPGCVDPAAINYNPLADPGDGSCIYPLGGCTDPDAFNYNPLATFNDGTCQPKVYGCTQSGSTNFDPNANTDDGSCIPCVYGCTDSGAHNYDPDATCDDGSCDSPSGGPIGCCCDLVSVGPVPIEFQNTLPPGGNFDCEILSYQNSINAAPPHGYKLVIGQTKGNSYSVGYPNNTWISLICDSGTAPTLVGILYQDEIEGTWYTYDPFLTQPAITDVLIVYVYTTGLNVWRQIYLPSSPGGTNIYTLVPVREGVPNVFDPNIGEQCGS